MPQYKTMQEYYAANARKYIEANAAEIRREYWKRKMEAQEGNKWASSYSF